MSGPSYSKRRRTDADDPPLCACLLRLGHKGPCSPSGKALRGLLTAKPNRA